MKFYNYINITSDFNKSSLAFGEPTMTREELYNTAKAVLAGEYVNGIDDYKLGICGIICNTINIENVWISDNRPYYDVYPSVSEFVSKLDLNFTPSQLKMPHNLKALLLKFYEGHDLHYMLFTITHIDDRTVFSYVINQGYGDAGIGMMQYSMSLRNDQTIEERLKEIYQDVFLSATEDQSHERRVIAQARWDAIVKLFRIIGTVCLIGSDPDLIEPQVLTNDLSKVNGDNIRKLVDKAKKRGKFGFSLGKSLESIPHTRRPHMYWQAYGPKYSLRRYRTRKGSVIHKDKMVNVPTGFEEDESVHT